MESMKNWRRFDMSNNAHSVRVLISVQRILVISMIISIGLILVSYHIVWAEDFLDLPILPGGHVLTKTESRLEIVYGQSPDELTNFYKNALQGQKDIAIKNRGDHTLIEDHGARPWHSITIKKNGAKGSNVAIVGFSWTWVFGTLVLRFFGVFAVLVTLYLAMTLSSAIISRLLSRQQAKV